MPHDAVLLTRAPRARRLLVVGALVAAAAAGALAPIGSAGAAVAEPSSAPSSARSSARSSADAGVPGQPYLLRLVGAGPARMPDVERAGYDVLEVRDGDDFFVLGDVRKAEWLRGMGFTVRVERPMAAQVPVAAAGAATSAFGTYPTFFGGYHTVAAHYKHLADVAAAKPKLAKVVTFGSSWRKSVGRGGHPMQAICLTKQAPGTCALNPTTTRPRMLLITAIHARELPTAEMAWNWIDELATDYGTRAEITRLLDTTEVWVVPLANPDGRDIVETGGASPLLQRKNANDTAGRCGASGQVGVDLNRNFPVKWGVGSDTIACSEVFRGASKASESETKAIRRLEAALFRDQRGPAETDAAPATTSGAILTYHNYAGVVLYPWNYTSSPAPNKAGLNTLARGLATYNRYSVGQAPDLLYEVGGDTDDDAYGRLGVPSLTIELGGTGACFDFLAPYRCVAGFYAQERKGLLWYAQNAKAPYRATLPTP